MGERHDKLREIVSILGWMARSEADMEPGIKEAWQKYVHLVDEYRNLLDNARILSRAACKIANEIAQAPDVSPEREAEVAKWVWMFRISDRAQPEPERGMPMVDFIRYHMASMKGWLDPMADRPPEPEHDDGEEP